MYIFFDPLEILILEKIRVFACCAALRAAASEISGSAASSCIWACVFSPGWASIFDTAFCTSSRGTVFPLLPPNDTNFPAELSYSTLGSWAPSLLARASARWFWTAASSLRATSDIFFWVKGLSREKDDPSFALKTASTVLAISTLTPISSRDSFFATAPSAVTVSVVLPAMSCMVSATCSLVWPEISRVPRVTPGATRFR